MCIYVYIYIYIFIRYIPGLSLAGILPYIILNVKFKLFVFLHILVPVLFKFLLSFYIYYFYTYYLPYFFPTKVTVIAPFAHANNTTTAHT